MLEEAHSSNQATSTPGELKEEATDEITDKKISLIIPSQFTSEVQIKIETNENEETFPTTDSKDTEDSKESNDKTPDTDLKSPPPKRKRRRRFSHNWSMRRRPSKKKPQHVSDNESDANNSEEDNTDKNDDTNTENSDNGSDSEDITETDDSGDSNDENDPKISRSIRQKTIQRQSRAKTTTKKSSKSTNTQNYPKSTSRNKNRRGKEGQQKGKRPIKIKESDQSDNSEISDYDDDDDDDNENSNSKYRNESDNESDSERDGGEDHENIICCIARCIRAGKFDSKLIEGPLKFKAGMKSGLLCDHHFGLYVTRMKCCIEGCNNYADSSPLCKINQIDPSNQQNIRLKQNYFNGNQICYNHYMLLTNKVTMVTRSQASLPQQGSTNTITSHLAKESNSARKYDLRSNDPVKSELSTPEKRKPNNSRKRRRIISSNDKERDDSDNTEDEESTENDDSDNSDSEESSGSDEGEVKEEIQKRRRSRYSTRRGDKSADSTPTKRSDLNSRRKGGNNKGRINTRRNTIQDSLSGDSDEKSSSNDGDGGESTSRVSRQRNTSRTQSTRRLRSADKRKEANEDASDDDSSSDDNSDNEGRSRKSNSNQGRKVKVKQEELSDVDDDNESSSEDKLKSSAGSSRSRKRYSGSLRGTQERSYSFRRKTYKEELIEIESDSPEEINFSDKICWRRGCNRPTQTIPFLKPLNVYSCKSHAEQFEKKLVQALAMQNLSFEKGRKDRICGFCCRIIGTEIDSVECSNRECPYAFCRNCIEYLLFNKEKHDSFGPYKNFKEIKDREDTWVCWVCNAEKVKAKKRDRERYILKLLVNCEHNQMGLSDENSDDENRSIHKRFAPAKEKVTTKKKAEAQATEAPKNKQSSEQNTSGHMTLRSHDHKVVKEQSKTHDAHKYHYTQHELRSSTRKRKIYSVSSSPQKRRGGSHNKSDNEESSEDEDDEEDEEDENGNEENEEEGEVEEEDNEERPSKDRENENFGLRMKKIMAEYEKRAPMQRKRFMLSASEKLSPIKQFFLLIMKIACLLNEQENDSLSKTNPKDYETLYDSVKILYENTSDSFNEWLLDDFTGIIPTLEAYFAKLKQEQKEKSDEKEVEIKTERNPDEETLKPGDMDSTTDPGQPPSKRPKLELPEDLLRVIGKLDKSAEGCLKITKSLEDASIKLYKRIKHEGTKLEKSLKEHRPKHPTQSDGKRDSIHSLLNTLKRKSRDKHNDIADKIKCSDGFEKEIESAKVTYRQETKNQKENFLSMEKELRMISSDRCNLAAFRKFLTDFIQLHESYTSSFEKSFWANFQELSQKKKQQQALLEHHQKQMDLIKTMNIRPQNNYIKDISTARPRLVAVYHNKCASHIVPANHFDQSQRFINAIAGVKLYKGFINIIEDPCEPPPCAISFAHGRDYIKELVDSEKFTQTTPQPILFRSRNLRQGNTIKEGLELAPYVIKSSIISSTFSAGSVCKAIDCIREGSAQMGFCVTRSPGHGVGKSGPGLGSWTQGPGLLNSTAIGCFYAKAFMNIDRIAIVDLDATHCNGTEEIFGGCNWVYVYSIHAYSGTHHKYLPGTGGPQDQHPDNIMNVPVKIGERGDVWLDLISKKIVPSLERFRPQLIFLSIGFNGIHSDFSRLLNLTENDYIMATRMIANVAAKYSNMRIVSVLEGGYLPGDEITRNVSNHIGVLLSTQPQEPEPRTVQVVSNQYPGYAKPQGFTQDYGVKVTNLSGGYAGKNQYGEYTRTQLNSNAREGNQLPGTRIQGTILNGQKLGFSTNQPSANIITLSQNQLGQIRAIPIHYSPQPQQKSQSKLQLQPQPQLQQTPQPQPLRIQPKPLQTQQNLEDFTKKLQQLSSQQPQKVALTDNFQKTTQQQNDTGFQLPPVSSQRLDSLLPPLKIADNPGQENSTAIPTHAAVSLPQQLPQPQLQQTIPPQGNIGNNSNDGNKGSLSFLLID